MENFASAERNNRPETILHHQKSSSNQKVFVAVYHFCPAIKTENFRKVGMPSITGVHKFLTLTPRTLPGGIRAASPPRGGTSFAGTVLSIKQHGRIIYHRNDAFTAMKTKNSRLTEHHHHKNNVNSRRWLEYIFVRLSITPATEIDSLLPHRWNGTD